MKSRIKILEEFEPEGWKDWALIPWWMVRWAIAWLWFQFLLLIRRIRHPRWLDLWERHGDPRPFLCSRCLWAGPYRRLVHTYGDDGLGDVEPIDECPDAGGQHEG